MVEERCSITLENEGQKLFGVLHLPVNRPPKVPAVLIFHGFGDNKVGSNRLYVTHAQQLVAHGIAVFRIDFRGCGDSEGELKDTTVQGELSDALQSIQFVKNHSSIDPDRLGILGISLGGSISVLAAAHSKCIKSLGLWAPVASGRIWRDDWMQMHSEETVEFGNEGELLYKGKAIGPRFQQEFAAMHLDLTVKEISHVSMLHIQGEQDTTVTVNHGVCFENWRQEASAQNRFIRLPESDHRFIHQKEQQILLQETLHWFKSTL